jgi:hypothetical protein
MKQLLGSGNPALIQAMQMGLSRMIGQSSGYLEGLPDAVKTRIAYLEDLQQEYDQLEDKFEEELKALEAKYKSLYGTYTLNSHRMMPLLLLQKEYWIIISKNSLINRNRYNWWKYRQTWAGTLSTLWSDTRWSKLYELLQPNTGGPSTPTYPPNVWPLNWQIADSFEIQR